MKNVLILLTLTIALSGCWLDRFVRQPFPDVPTHLMAAPRAIQTIRPVTEDHPLVLGDPTASGVPLSVVTKTITENYKACTLNNEQLIKLQEWVVEQKSINP